MRSENPTNEALNRRDFIRLAAAGTVLAGVPSWMAGCAGGPDATADEPLAVAIAVADWLRSKRIENRGGYTWPRTPEDGARAALDLWSGTPGIILFLLELHHATGDDSYRQEALDAAYLLQGAYLEHGGWPAAAGSGLDDPSLDDPGLYTGWAGVAFTLAEVARAGGDELARTGALMLFDAVQGSAQIADGRRAWYLENPVEARYDIVGGSAGIGVALLYAHEVLGFPPALEAATETGRYLLDVARPLEEGVAWPTTERDADPSFDFFHGTAGVAFFLARLAGATGDDAFLEAARAGAAGAAAAGTVGSPRLFHQLARVTGERAWDDRAIESAQALRGDQVASLDARLGDLFLELDGAGDAPGRLDVARELATRIVAAASTADEGLHWREPDPDNPMAPARARTGWMDGAAGIGAFFLHLDGAAAGRAPRIVLPDHRG